MITTLASAYVCILPSFYPSHVSLVSPPFPSARKCRTRTNSKQPIALLLPARIPSHVAPRILLELARRPAKLVRDAGLERVVGVRLDQQLSDRVEHGAHAARRLPVLGFQHAEADRPRAVVRHVRVVDARREGDKGCLEGVVGGEDDGEVEGAARVGGAGGADEFYGPGVKV